VTLVIDTDIDVTLDEAVLNGDEAVRYITSGGYVHHVKKSMALAYVNSDCASAGDKLKVEILGELYDAEVINDAIYNANVANMRS